MSDQGNKIARSVAAISESMLSTCFFDTKNMYFFIETNNGTSETIMCESDNIENAFSDYFAVHEEYAKENCETIESISCEFPVRSFSEVGLYIEKRLANPNISLRSYDDELFMNAYSLFLQEKNAYLQHAKNTDAKKYFAENAPSFTEHDFSLSSLNEKRETMQNILNLYDQTSKIDPDFFKIAEDTDLSSNNVLGYSLTFPNYMYQDFGMNVTVGTDDMANLISSTTDFNKNGFISIPEETFYSENLFTSMKHILQENLFSSQEPEQTLETAPTM